MSADMTNRKAQEVSTMHVFLLKKESLSLSTSQLEFLEGLVAIRLHDLKKFGTTNADDIGNCRSLLSSFVDLRLSQSYDQ